MITAVRKKLMLRWPLDSRVKCINLLLTIKRIVNIIDSKHRHRHRHHHQEQLNEAKSTKSRINNETFFYVDANKK